MVTTRAPGVKHSNVEMATNGGNGRESVVAC